MRMIAPNRYCSAIDDESDAFCNLAIGGERGVDGHIFTIQALKYRFTYCKDAGYSRIEPRCEVIRP